LACEVSDISDCLSGFLHPIERVGFEAGTMSQHLFFGPQAEGFDVVCMEARQVNAALSAMRNKTDRNDARGIAHLRLRPGAPVWPTPAVGACKYGTYFWRNLEVKCGAAEPLENASRIGVVQERLDT
jgi:hypothetical protein